jgi:hypothetical protein
VDTDARQQRESRVVPPPYADGELNLWEAVDKGIIDSSNIDERMMPKTPLPPYQRQERPFSSPNFSSPKKPPPPPKPPLGDITNVATKQEIAMLKRHMKLQNDVITGMCRLRAFEAENRLAI